MAEEIIRTRELHIVDNKDNSRITLKTDGKGNPQFIMRDSAGCPSILISIDENNEPCLSLNASGSMLRGVEIEGKTLSSSHITLSQVGDSMSLSIGSSMNRILLFVNERNESSIYLHDEDGQVKAVITSSYDNGPGNVLIIESNKIIKELI